MLIVISFSDSDNYLGGFPESDILSCLFHTVCYERYNKLGGFPESDIL